MMQPSADPAAIKQELRRRGLAAREAQPQKEKLSELICARFAALAEYAAASTVMSYVDAQGEVRTRHFLPVAIKHGKRVVVPYCLAEDLALFRLEHIGELAPGAFGILEPRPELRGAPRKTVELAEIDLVMVPGVAFDRRGARLGRGRGYYDRFLRRLRPDAVLVGLAFECQLLDEIPTLAHDVFMDKVITEKGLYPGRGRTG